MHFQYPFVLCKQVLSRYDGVAMVKCMLLVVWAMFLDGNSCERETVCMAIIRHSGHQQKIIMHSKRHLPVTGPLLPLRVQSPISVMLLFERRCYSLSNLACRKGKTGCHQ